MREDARYEDVRKQVCEILHEIATDRDPLAHIAGMGRAWLAAELYSRNEITHLRATKARMDIIQALEWRIAAEVVRG